MLKSKEFEFLNVKITKVNNRVHNIDRGGCGLFAVKLAIRLKKIGVSSKLVVLDRYSSTKENYIEDIKEIGYVSPNCSKPAHIMVKVGNRYIDNNGVFTIKQVEREWPITYAFEIEHTKFTKAANHRRGWNSYFERTKSSISIIDSHLDKVCKELDKLKKKKVKKIVNNKKKNKR